MFHPCLPTVSAFALPWRISPVLVARVLQGDHLVIMTIIIMADIF